MGIITNSMSGAGDNSGKYRIELAKLDYMRNVFTDEQWAMIQKDPTNVEIIYKDCLYTNGYNQEGYYNFYGGFQNGQYNISVHKTQGYTNLNSTYFNTLAKKLEPQTITVSESDYVEAEDVYAIRCSSGYCYNITVPTSLTHTSAYLKVYNMSTYWFDYINFNNCVVECKSGEAGSYILIDRSKLLKSTMKVYNISDASYRTGVLFGGTVEESPNPICYDTNETIDFTAIMAEYLADTTKSGKIRPFTNNDTLLSADAIKKIIDGNYKMFSFNAKIGAQIMEAYMPISYHSDVNYYTFKGQVTFLNSGAWNTIDVQMQFIHNSTAGTYSNNPGYGFFKFTAETAISA